ncbi:MAG: TlyA family RNA methyltransferase, partial [Deltaproteobacteria bacterium]|nr:TlyA family RNA methyltransferase [Deltaproteobacteria bacterium]
ADLRLRGEPLPYVSRGGIKLQAALDAFHIEVTGRTGLDVGASTGGFTDCLLKRGARRVYAVDVGYGQLAWSLRQDPRVVVIERANIRTLPREAIPEACDVVAIDVSFISLRLVLPRMLTFVAPGAILVALVKPQFEVGREAVGKGGVVRDAKARRAAVERIVGFCAELGLGDVACTESPLRGAKGNVEYLLRGVCAGEPVRDFPPS